MDSKLAEWRRALATAGLDEDARRAAASQLADEITVFMARQKAQIELSRASATPIWRRRRQLADLPLPARLLPPPPPSRRRQRIRRQAPARLLERVDEFVISWMGRTASSRRATRRLTIVGQAQGLLRGERRPVAPGRRRAGSAGRRRQSGYRCSQLEALGAQRLGSAVLIGMVLLSLLSSGLIVWRYVDRNLVARLRALSDSMLAIAGGDLRAPLPAAGHDELGAGRRADRVPRHRGRGAGEEPARAVRPLETIDYGVLMLEPDLRVRIHNRAFRELSGMPPESFAGQIYFQDVLEHNRRRGVYAVPDAQVGGLRPDAPG